MPDTYFDQPRVVLDTVPPLPGEEAMYAQFGALLAAADRDPTLGQQMIDVATEVGWRGSDPPHSYERFIQPADVD